MDENPVIGPFHQECREKIFIKRFLKSGGALEHCLRGIVDNVCDLKG
jgi:hypothetical protein